MSPTFGYLCRFLLPLSLARFRSFSAVPEAPAVEMPSVVPGGAPLSSCVSLVYSRSPGSPRRRRPARPVRPLPLPASPLRSGARLVRCRPDLATPGTPCASRRLRRHSAPHSLTRPRGFTPGRAKLWERRPSLAASLD